MFFLNPLFLWTLLGLAVPVAIHLWSKKQGKTIKVGSVKFLQESDSRKSRSIKLNEFFLLLLRMLIITILALILAEPHIKHKIENSEITYLVEASLLTSSSEVKKLTDSLNNTAEVRFLQTGFPEYSTENLEKISSETPNYWRLATEMQTLETDSIVVFTNAFLSGIKGERPEIGKNINWINLNPGETETHRIGVIRKGEEITLISGISDAEIFRFQKEKKDLTDVNLEDILVEEQDTLRIKMYSEEEFNAEAKYLKTAFSTLEKYLELPITIKDLEEENLNSSSEEFLVWLSSKTAPKTAWRILKFKGDSLTKSIIEPGNAKNEYYLTRSLNSENIVEEHLGDQLIEMLNFYPEIKNEAEKYDRRTVNLAHLKPNFEIRSELNAKPEGRDISKYLWIGLFILILLERALARYRKQ